MYVERPLNMVVEALDVAPPLPRSSRSPATISQATMKREPEGVDDALDLLTVHALGHGGVELLLFKDAGLLGGPLGGGGLAGPHVLELVDELGHRRRGDAAHEPGGHGDPTGPDVAGQVVGVVESELAPARRPRGSSGR